MKLKKFLKKHPECEKYHIICAYYLPKKARFYIDEYDMGLSRLAPPGGIYTTLRVVGVDHETKTVWVVYGNV